MLENKKQQACKDSAALRAAYQATFDVDEWLIKLVGNLTLRQVALTAVEHALLDAAIIRLADARSELITIDPNRYL